jgi:hypothetical protein
MKKRWKEKLPRWKKRVNEFNESNLKSIEKFVKKAIPWLVLLLLFIIIGEFAGPINEGIVVKITGHSSHFWENIEHFMHEYHTQVLFLDGLIILFFVIDLYFNFFKTATFVLFVKRYFLDLIAVTPVGLFFKGSGVAGLAGVAEEISLGQEVTHVATESERIIAEGEKTAKVLTEGEKTAKVATEAERTAKAAAEAEKAAKAGKLTRGARTARIASRAPRAVRLWRLKGFVKKKK